MLLGILEGPMLTAGRPGQTLTADRHRPGRQTESPLHGHGITLLRLARAGEAPRLGAQSFRPLRQVIESIDDTLEGRLGLEQQGRTPTGVRGRALRRVLALTAAIWHDDHVGAPTPRTPIACDHWALESFIEGASPQPTPRECVTTIEGLRMQVAGR